MSRTKVFNSLAASQTWKTGTRIHHTQKAGSSVDMNKIKAFRNALDKQKQSAKVLKRGRDGEPITISKDGRIYHKRTDGEWYVD